jgi:dTDP-glucose pyrophosphorylase
MVSKAVILAAGSASRMQQNIEKYIIDKEELSAVRKGEKMAARFKKHPFLDYQILNLIQSGLKDITIVLKPDDVFFTKYYETHGKRLFPEAEISFSFQEIPDGTAHAVLAAEKFIHNDRCIVLNGDNNYSSESIKMLMKAPQQYSAMIAYDYEGFNRWTRQRLKAFAVIITSRGKLREIIEKARYPEQYIIRDHLYTKNNKRIEISERTLFSMNLWCFNPEIVQECKKVKRHASRKSGKPGEYELPDAVMQMVRRGKEVLVYYACEDVLDLTRAEDIEIVGDRIQKNMQDKISELEKRHETYINSIERENK